MPSNYKKLGDYIKEVNIRNSDLKINKLIGVSIEKKFISSVANIIGTDMSVYKIIKKNQLACKLMSVGRDEKLPIDLYINNEPAIISSAYYVFEPINDKVLLPEYLKMWLFRSETDRYVGYISGGDVRGGISWNTFCEMPIIIPSPEKQLEIVHEYKVIQNHIALNHKLITKLEETAQAIYKQWFVDFDFPDENGKPYKSNGGEMEFCEELEKDIPVGWEFGYLSSYTLITAGGDKPKIFSNTKTDLCNIPVFSNSSANEGLYGYTNKASVFEKCITISARGAIIGYTVLRLSAFFPIVRLIVIKPIDKSYLNYMFYTVLNFKYDNQTSSAQGQLTVPDISSYKIIKPDKIILIKFQKQSSIIINNIDLLKKGNQKLAELKDLLLAKMTRAEEVKKTVN
jgi:type I restriction enzyme S subunit